MKADEETSPVRPGEEIDAEALRAYLRDSLDIAADRIEISQFPSGSSNLTYSVIIDGSEYVLRRPPFGNRVPSAHDMGREFHVLSRLAGVYGPAPKPLALCEDASVIGAPFFLMERLHGIIIRGTAPHALETDAPLRDAVCRSFIRNLAAIHAIDFRGAGLEGLGKPEGYARRQVQGWTRRYFESKTHQFDELEWAIDWLNENMPVDSGVALVHNDYKFDNVILNPEDLTEIVGVLDWEMATIGDPMMDLGTTLGYWMSRNAREELLSMPFNPRILMENVTRQRLVEWYAEASGCDVSNVNYYYVFGLFKIAVIAQQIYARFALGHTKDRRFAEFHRFVEVLGRIAFANLE
jgi:aminoglycoside phosphotransferase (APT) family kinase protein